MYIAIAIPVLMAGNALQKVADTQGNDIYYMMQAVQTLGTSFLVRIIALVTMVLLLVLVMVFFFLFFAAMMALIFGSGA